MRMVIGGHPRILSRFFADITTGRRLTSSSSSSSSDLRTFESVQGVLLAAMSHFIRNDTMFRSAAILRWSCQAACVRSPRGVSPEQCLYFGVPWRWFSFAELEHTVKLGTYPVSIKKSSTMHSTVQSKNCWSVTAKHHYNQSLGFSGVSSARRMSSTTTSTRTKPDGLEGAVSKVSSTGVSEVDNTNDGGNTWIDLSEDAHRSAADASTAAGNTMKRLNDEITLHVQELFGNHTDLEKVIVPLGGTLIGTAMAWFVMPIVLRRLHKYASDSTKKPLSYETSLWSALEDPTKYIITFMAFSQMAAVIEPSISVYLPQAWKGAFVVSFVWFLHRWKTNFIGHAMAKQPAKGTDRDRLSAFDKVSSLGVIALGVIALAEACGVPVQSILTVGGVGGVATAFAARDILGNMLSGFSLHFSRPFSIGDNIKAGSVEGQVVEIGLTSTLLINTEKLPVVVPNSLFSSQVIVNKSRTQWHASMSKLPVRIEDIEKIPAITEEIKAMLMYNPKIDAPYCYLSQLQLESSRGELTIACNIKSTKIEEWSSTEQEILLSAASIIKRHQLWTPV